MGKNIGGESQAVIQLDSQSNMKPGSQDSSTDQSASQFDD